MRNSNPLFSNVSTNYEEISENQATYQGITIKTLFLLGIAGIVGVFAALMLDKITNYSAFYTLLALSSIVGFISVIIGRSNKSAAPYCSVLYAVCEGLFLGTLTRLANELYQGIAILAIITTVVIFLICLALFACGALRNVSTLRRVSLILGLSLISMTIIYLILEAFNVSFVTNLTSNYFAITILVEALFLLYASITLALTFNEATYYVQSGANKGFEWIAAFGFLFSILYIYLEAIYLLISLMGRSKD